MVWSNWQGAIWRGAAVMLLFWSGLAWTQTPTPPPAGEAERTMVLHDENGKSTKCRVLETWQLPDGRRAHLLEAMDTGEKITIVTEPSPATNPRAMPIRIFSWGQGRSAPPEGTPLPPHLRMPSGVVIRNEEPMPAGGVMGQGPGPTIINSTDDTPLGGSFAGPGTRTVERVPARPFGGGLLARIFPGRAAAPTSDEIQIIQFPPGMAPQTPAPPTNPLLQVQAVEGTGENNVVRADQLPVPNVKGVVLAKGIDPMSNPLLQVQGIGTPGGSVNPAAGIVPGIPLPPPPGIVPGTPLPPPPGIVPGTPLPPPPGVAPPPLSIPPTNTLPGAPSADTGSALVAGGVAPPAPSTPSPIEARKPWRPGENIAAWWQSKSAKAEPKPVVPPDPVVLKDDKSLPAAKDEKIKKADDFLTQENKIAEKKLAEKAERVYKGGFSTAMNPTPPEMKKPEPTPLAMTGAAKSDKAPPMPFAKDDITPTAGSDADKRDMFGTATNPAAPPGRSVLDVAGLVKLPPPPVARLNDPMLAPERLPTPPPKAGVLPPIGRDVRPPMDMSAKSPWPPGAQSVLSARSGLEGPVAFVPVPTVTVPQPNRPPTPPPPAMPDAPQLNAFVNAFSAPPVPRGAAQMPQQGMMPAQAMMPYGNPMMQPMQPYAYGYPQMPGYAMNPYGMQAPMMNPMMAQQQMPYPQPMMASQGPATNYGRQYMGPMPPQNPFAAPTMPAGYNYPPMMPQQQPMMPQQQPMIQPAAFQQMQPAAQAQQVEQLIKVMRENAYPAQREWAATMLASYEWRMHPQIVPALLQSAGQDPAATVRAGCVSCLGRMQAAVEPVFGTLHALRSDIDPRVRSAVEQAFVQLGQTPMTPQ